MTSTSNIRRILIVGNDGGTNIGASLVRAARARGLDATLVDTRRAYDAPKAVARVNWWLRGHRPSRLMAFGEQVIATCSEWRPDLLIATGLAPLDQTALDAIGRLGIPRVSYLTDDPWNPAFRSRWFLAALPRYSAVWSARTSNLDDLKAHGCANVGYLPFAFDPELFFPQAPEPDEREQYGVDVSFAGGADADRIPILRALIDANLLVSLYGDYWDRFASTRRAARGHAAPETLRKSAAAAVSLCLVRRANRDGHTMRSFEVPAVGGCMLAEDTAEHRSFFGASGHAVTYFSSTDELVRQVRALVAEPAERRRLASAAHALVTRGGFTYGDRLQTMIEGAA